jgi:hypothetical protein
MPTPHVVAAETPEADPMADTVSASTIVASLGDGGPEFVIGPPGSEVATTDLVSTSVAGAFHVGGGAHADSVSGFGSPLLVDFVTFRATPGPDVAPPTVPGYSAGANSYEPAHGVAGAIQQLF